MSQQSRFIAIISSRLFFVVALCAILLIVYGITRGVMRRVEVENQISALKNDIHSLETKNEELSRLITYFQTPEFKEREARLRLGLQKQGENVVVIPDLAQGNTNTSDSAVPQEQLPNWKLWLNYFFH